MKRMLASSFVAGLLFAGGLCLSGLTDPAKVIGFLDFFGHWDPSMGFVMFGAVGTYALLSRLIVRRQAPLFAAKFSLPTKRNLDAPLVIGSALFGVGWGLAGYCPGPVVTSLASGARSAFVFTGGMLVGLAAYATFERASAARAQARLVAGAVTSAASGGAR
jgi:uncharacterized protein